MWEIVQVDEEAERTARRTVPVRDAPLECAFRISIGAINELRQADPQRLSDADFRFVLAAGEVKLMDHRSGTAFCEDVALLGFATLLFDAVCALQVSEQAAFDFLDSDYHWRFVRNGDRVTATEDLSDWTCTAPIQEFQDVAVALVQGICAELVEQIPYLTESDAFQDIRREYGAAAFGRAQGTAG